MAVIKCKMCGGDLELLEDSSVCECEYCGTKQTVPKADDEKKLKLFERANRLRTACEFDKAAGVYETIVADFDQEAEAYWGLILCKFGIEYVDDPATGKKIPTCHRSSFDSLMDDPNFEMVMECADPIARRVYREEAKAIEELRRRIIEVSSKEEPYDVFISYKELAEDGQRTLDSVIAQDICTELTDRGFRVFFSRISLESKLGVEYEPYIFAALNSAKVMLVVGTDYDYFNAVWVKNEWSRFLALIAKGEKKTLIPVFKGIDAYDMPKEFNKLAAQDMGKVGAMQDLLRGVEKILGRKQPEPAAQPQQVIQQIVQGGGPNADSLIKRGMMALEDEEWDKAGRFCDQILSINAECPEAYLILAMVECKAHSRKEFRDKYVSSSSPLPASKNVKRLGQFAGSELKSWLEKLDQDYRAAVEREEKRKREQKEREQRQAEQERLDRQRRLEEAEKRLPEIRERLRPLQGMIAANWYATGAVRADGRVFATGQNDAGQCDVGRWEDVRAIAIGLRHSLGIRGDGTVIATAYTGDPKYNRGQCEVSSWKNIRQVAAGVFHSLGLRQNGTVVATQYRLQEPPDQVNRYCGQCQVATFTNIVEIAAGQYTSFGLKSNGTVVVAGEDTFGETKVSSWRDIVSISAGDRNTFGLRRDGTVVWAGSEYEKINVSGWTDIVAIKAGAHHVVGLRADGTVLAAGRSDEGQCNTQSWRDIVAIAAGTNHTVGLRADGQVLSTKFIEGKIFKDKGQCRTERWKLFDNYLTVNQEREELRKKQLLMQKASCEEELANLRGLFSGKRRREIEERLAQIEAELKKLG